MSTLIAAMTELQAEQAGKAVSESKNASLYQDATAGEPDWRDTLVWDLNGVLHLRRLLVLWAECKVPASDIGLFLVKVLYERDEHLGNRLTRMVNLDESYSNVALGIMKHYQIRDSDDQPMWMTLDLGEVDLRPSGNSSAGSSRSISVPTLTTGYTGSETTRQSFHTASTSSVDLPPRWPFYMSGADLEDFFLNNGPETSDDELSRRAPDKVVSLRSPSSITKLQVVMASSNPVPEPIAGDMIDPDQSYSTSSVGIDALQTQDVFHPGLTSARTGKSCYLKSHPSSRSLQETENSDTAQASHLPKTEKSRCRYRSHTW